MTNLALCAYCGGEHEAEYVPSLQTWMVVCPNIPPGFAMFGPDMHGDLIFIQQPTEERS